MFFGGGRTPLVDGWFNINISSDGITPKIHINGVEIPIFSSNVVGSYVRMTPNVGSLKMQGQSSVYGDFDEFNFWKNRQLSPLEIQQLYNDGFGYFFNSFAPALLNNLTLSYSFEDTTSNVSSDILTGNVNLLTGGKNGKMLSGFINQITSLTDFNTNASLSNSTQDIAFNFNFWYKPKIQNVRFFHKTIGQFNTNRYEYSFEHTSTQIKLIMYSLTSSSNRKEILFNYSFF